MIPINWLKVQGCWHRFSGQIPTMELSWKTVRCTRCRALFFTLNNALNPMPPLEVPALYRILSRKNPLLNLSCLSHVSLLQSEGAACKCDKSHQKRFHQWKWRRMHPNISVNALGTWNVHGVSWALCAVKPWQNTWSRCCQLDWAVLQGCHWDSAQVQSLHRFLSPVPQVQLCLPSRPWQHPAEQFPLPV